MKMKIIKNRKIIASILIALFFLSCKTEKGFVLDVEVDGIEDLEVALLMGKTSGNVYGLDEIATAQMVDGKVQFKGELPHTPAEVAFKFKKQIKGGDKGESVYETASRLPILITNDTKALIKIHVPEKQPNIVVLIGNTYEEPKIYYDLEVIGSDILDEYITLKNKFDAEYDPAKKPFNEKIEALRKMNSGIKYTSWSKEDKQKNMALNNEKRKIDTEKGNAVLQYAQENLNSVAAYALVGKLFNGPYEQKKAYYNNVSQSILNSQLELHRKVIKRNTIRIKKENKTKASNVSIGNSFKDFSMTDVNGDIINLGEFVEKNKYTLLDFWASWCGPCRDENPHVLKAFNMYKDKGFNVVGVSLDKNKDNWLRAVKKDKMPWIQLSDLQSYKSKVIKDYGISAIPANFLINSNGTIVAINLSSKAVGDKNLFSKLQEVFE